jgi:DhnA family fructose-bisphosphate aldolase class Ia
MGMDGVGVHANMGSIHESEMLKQLSNVVSEAQHLGIPVLALMYCRKEGPNGDDNFDDERVNDIQAYCARVRHAVRVGMELGADIIKTHYTGTPATFSEVIEAAAGVPVMIAGGLKKSKREALQQAAEAMSAGAKGVAFGRNVFQRSQPGAFVSALRKVVQEKQAVDSVLSEHGHGTA